MLTENQPKIMTVQLHIQTLLKPPFVYFDTKEKTGGCFQTVVQYCLKGRPLTACVANQQCKCTVGIITTLISVNKPSKPIIKTMGVIFS